MTRRWQDVRPHVVTDETRVAEARQEMEADIGDAEDRAYEQAMRGRKRGGED